VGNKVALVLTALAVSLVANACGGTQGGPEAANTTPTAPQTSRGRAAKTDPSKGCDEQGINGTQLRVGTCTEEGVQYVVGNYGALLRLRTLAVAIQGVSVAPGDAGNGRLVRAQRGALLRVTLQIQNRDKVSHRWGFGRTMLGIGASNYLERLDVERHIHAEALGVVNGGRVAPGETLRGDVLFDITREDYENIQREGRFFIWNFGGRASPNFTRREGQVGQIRLYATEGQ
jgi:hypothetical protein